MPALLTAVSAGRSRQVRLLLDGGANVDATDDCNQTALIRSVFIDNAKNRLRIVKLLLKRGATVSKCDVVGRNALSWACLYGQDCQVAMMLEEMDVDLNLNHGDMNGQTALHHAATSGSAATVRRLVQALQKYGLSMDVPDYNGITPLMIAIRGGNDVCASIMINQGCATVGKNEQLPEAQIKEDIWAKKTLFSMPRSARRYRTQFPPILSPAMANKIKYRENRAKRQSVLNSIDSDEDIDNCSSIDSSIGSDSSYLTDRSFDSIIDIESDVTTKTISGLSRTTLGSKTSSIEVNIDTGTDSGKIFSSPCRQTPFISTRDVYKLFTAQSQQMTSNYCLGYKTTPPAPLPSPNDVTCNSTSSSPMWHPSSRENKQERFKRKNSDLRKFITSRKVSFSQPLEMNCLDETEIPTPWYTDKANKMSLNADKSNTMSWNSDKNTTTSLYNDKNNTTSGPNNKTNTISWHADKSTIVSGNGNKTSPKCNAFLQKKTSQHNLLKRTPSLLENLNKATVLPRIHENGCHIESVKLCDQEKVKSEPSWSYSDM